MKRVILLKISIDKYRKIIVALFEFLHNKTVRKGAIEDNIKLNSMFVCVYMHYLYYKMLKINVHFEKAQESLAEII